MKTPKISVLMPVYNSERYLKEAIESILNQTFTDFEFIIINDGSTDKSEEIILSYNDSRIVYIKNKDNLQIVKTLNKGITLAKGKYIARMDADDVSLPNRFEKQIEYMEQNPDIDICGTWISFFGDKKGIWKTPESHDDIKAMHLFNPAIAHPTIMGKKEFFLNNLYIPEYNKVEDYELWVRSIPNYHFANISLVLLNYRTHKNQSSGIRQTTLSFDIRKNLLKKIGCVFSDDELKNFLDYSLETGVDYKSIFTKILQCNKKSKYFNQYSLGLLLAQRYWLSIENNIYFSSYRTYLKSPLYQYKTFSYKTHLKIIIKCFLRYINVK